MRKRVGHLCPATLRVQSGFTLVELVIIIVLLGVLSVVAISRFDDGKGYNEFLLQKRLLSALRHVQMQAMQDTRDGYCHRLNFNYSPSSLNFGPPVATLASASASASCQSGIDFSAASHLRTDNGEISAMEVTMSGYDGNATAPVYIGFNNVGKPLTPGALCASGSGCRISFAGKSTASVCVNSQGFIYEC